MDCDHSGTLPWKIVEQSTGYGVVNKYRLSSDYGTYASMYLHMQDGPFQLSSTKSTHVALIDYTHKHWLAVSFLWSETENVFEAIAHQNMATVTNHSHDHNASCLFHTWIPPLLSLPLHCCHCYRHQISHSYSPFGSVSWASLLSVVDELWLEWRRTCMRNR